MSFVLKYTGEPPLYIAKEFNSGWPWTENLGDARVFQSVQDLLQFAQRITKPEAHEKGEYQIVDVRTAVAVVSTGRIIL